MTQIALNTLAPEFELPDLYEKKARLSDQFGKSNVLLVFNRGFI